MRDILKCLADYFLRFTFHAQISSHPVYLTLDKHQARVPIILELITGAYIHYNQGLNPNVSTGRHVPLLCCQLPAWLTRIPIYVSSVS